MIKLRIKVGEEVVEKELPEAKRSEVLSGLIYVYDGTRYKNFNVDYHPNGDLIVDAIEAPEIAL